MEKEALPRTSVPSEESVEELKKHSKSKRLTHSDTAHDSNETGLDPACLTHVNPPRSHGVGPLGGRRVVWGVRIDEELKLRVLPKLRRFWGSDCRAVESFLMAFEAAFDALLLESGGGVNRFAPSITIESLNVVREQRSRRKLDVADPIGYSVDENAIVEETVNRFAERHDRYGAIPNRMEVLKLIRHERPTVDGKTRMALASRIMKLLKEMIRNDQL